MAMTAEQEQKFETMLKEKLREQYLFGLRVGAMTVSQVVLDKLNDTSKPLMDRISDVKRFCKVSATSTEAKAPSDNGAAEAKEKETVADGE